MLVLVVKALETGYGYWIFCAFAVALLCIALNMTIKLSKGSKIGIRVGVALALLAYMILVTFMYIAVTEGYLRASDIDPEFNSFVNYFILFAYAVYVIFITGLTKAAKHIL